ncbi:MAG TPA: glycosyltransferase family 4 protein [Thermoplasmata archaeon]|nr:glycosyltransferase family 4 protein [Thermoplasmata archaeon]
MNILVIPDIEMPPTFERTPEMYRRLAADHELTRIRGRRDDVLQSLDRPVVSKALPYLLDRVRVIGLGLRAGRNRKFDLIFCETPHDALSGLVIGKVLNVPSVYDCHGSLELYARSTARSRGYRIAARTLDKILGRNMDGLLTVSQREADAYVDLGVPRQKIHVFPTPVDTEEINRRVEPTRHARESIPRAASEKPVLLFFGSFGYGPNLKALRFVNERLAPALEARGVRCRIQVAGRAIPPGTYHSSIEVLGFVEDIYPRIAEADLGLVPIWTGVGIIVKALDILAVGTPLIGTRFLTQGIPELVHHENALLAESEEDFIHLVAQSLQDLGSLRGIADRGRELVREKYSWTAHEEILKRILSDAARAKARTRGTNAG